MPGWPGAPLPNPPASLLWTLAPPEEGAQVLTLGWWTPFGNPRRTRRLFSYVFAHLWWQVSKLGLTPQSQPTIILFSETGFPSLTTECAASVALRSLILPPRTPTSLGPHFLSINQASMAPACARQCQVSCPWVCHQLCRRDAFIKISINCFFFFLFFLSQ